MVSGASSGIGKALAIELLKRGFNVSLAARREEIITDYLRDLFPEEVCEQRCLVVKTDVSREEDCKNWVETTYKHFGRIDILINNAGISMRGLFEECNLDVLRRLVDVNFWGDLLHALRAQISGRGQGQRRRRFVDCRLPTVAGPYGLFGLQGRHAGIADQHPHRKPQERPARVDCLSRLHGLQRAHQRLGQERQPAGETPRDEGKMMTAEEVARHMIWAIDRRKRSLILTPLGRLTVLASKIIPGFTEKVAFSYMAKEPNSPF